MKDEYDSNAVTMLGAERARKVQERVRLLSEVVASQPDRTSHITLRPIRLQAPTRGEAEDEVDRLLQFKRPVPQWVLAAGNDGTWVAYVSDYYVSDGTRGASDVIGFLSIDVHSRLGAWWLSHLWRAADLADAANTALARWEILPGAASARALLEGIAAFVVESAAFLDEWHKFKVRGVPNVAAFGPFRDDFLAALLQADSGTRVRTLLDDDVKLVRKNVLTLVDKFSKRPNAPDRELYDWLCDAVHPSFGSFTVYTATRGEERTTRMIGSDLARRSHDAPTIAEKIDPTVALAVADAIILSIEQMLMEIPRVRWMIDDFGLTTGAAYKTRVPCVGRFSLPGRNERCPCESGRKFKACTHKWGSPAEPPVATTT